MVKKNIRPRKKEASEIIIKSFVHNRGLEVCMLTTPLHFYLSKSCENYNYKNPNINPEI